MKWSESLFLDNAKLYALVLQGMWKNGEEYAKLLSDLLREKRLARCKVLDIPCGTGRISVPLARLRYSVTGIDLSPYFVGVARKKAKQFSVARRTSFVVGEMKEIGSMFPEGHFDAALNVFTSIGFGSENDDLVFFKGLRRVVRKGGLFIIGALASRDYIFSHFAERLYDETDKIMVIQKNELDVSHSKIKSRWRFYLKKGRSLQFAAEIPLDLRLYSPHEIAAMLESASWEVLDIYDSLRYRRPFNSSANGFTVIAEAA